MTSSTTQTLSLGILTLLGQARGPTIYASAHNAAGAEVGSVLLTIAEWTSLRAMVDVLAACDKQPSTLRRENERLVAVYEAAVAWHLNETTHLACCRADNNLHVAVGLAIDATKEPE